MPFNSAGAHSGAHQAKVKTVLELNSQGKVTSILLLSTELTNTKNVDISLSYTWSDTKDNTSYKGNVANTATLPLPLKQDSRDLSRMSYFDNPSRHKGSRLLDTFNILWCKYRGLVSGTGGKCYS